MELGTPPLYAEINRVSRDMDLSQLEFLGPFIQALGFISSNGELHKYDDDKIKTGKMIYADDVNLTGSFLLWRGSYMKDDCITPYIKSIGHKVHLPQNSSCSRNPKVGLDFALGIG